MPNGETQSSLDVAEFLGVVIGTTLRIAMGGNTAPAGQISNRDEPGSPTGRDSATPTSPTVVPPAAPPSAQRVFRFSVPPRTLQSIPTAGPSAVPPRVRRVFLSVPHVISLASAPKQSSTIIFCGCLKGCKNNSCRCRKNKQLCSSACLTCSTTGCCNRTMAA